MQLSHQPGETQVDFEAADVISESHQRRVALFVVTLMRSGASSAVSFLGNAPRRSRRRTAPPLVPVLFAILWIQPWNAVIEGDAFSGANQAGCAWLTFTIH